MKYWNYIVIIVFLGILMEVSGFGLPTNMLAHIGLNKTVTIVDGVPDTTYNIDLLNSTFWQTALVVIGLAIAGGAAASFLTRARPEKYIILNFVRTAGFLLFVGVLTSIISKAFTYGNWVGIIVMLILAPLVVGFVISVFDLFGGSSD